jgi:hypothetical protein
MGVCLSLPGSAVAVGVSNCLLHIQNVVRTYAALRLTRSSSSTGQQAGCCRAHSGSGRTQDTLAGNTLWTWSSSAPRRTTRSGQASTSRHSTVHYSSWLLSPQLVLREPWALGTLLLHPRSSGRVHGRVQPLAVCACHRHSLSSGTNTHQYGAQTITGVCAPPHVWMSGGPFLAQQPS